MSESGNSEARDIVCVAGGLALMVFGAGLILVHPGVRRTVLGNLTPFLPDLQASLQAGAGRVLPDVERYLKLRGM
jgi:hypothetical protein